MGKSVHGSGDKRIRMFEIKKRLSISGHLSKRMRKKVLSFSNEDLESYLKNKPNLRVNIEAIKKIPSAEKRFRILTKIVTQDPANWNNFAIVNELARTCERLGYFEQAKKNYLHILSLRSKDTYALHGLAFLAARERNIVQAKDWLMKAIEADPNDNKSYNAMGLMCLKSNVPLEAMKWFNITIEREPYNIVALFGLAMAHLSKGLYDDAEKFLNTILNIDTNDERANYGLGLLAFAKGQHGIAKSCFEKLLAINPGNTFAKHGLGDIALSQGEFATAETYYNDILKNIPLSEEALKGLAYASLAKGDEKYAAVLMNRLGFEVTDGSEIMTYRPSQYATDKCTSSIFRIGIHKDIEGSNIHFGVKQYDNIEVLVTIHGHLIAMHCNPKDRLIITVVPICPSIAVIPENDAVKKEGVLARILAIVRGFFSRKKRDR